MAPDKTNMHRVGAGVSSDKDSDPDVWNGACVAVKHSMRFRIVRVIYETAKKLAEKSTK